MDDITFVPALVLPRPEGRARLARRRPSTSSSRWPSTAPTTIRRNATTRWATRAAGAIMIGGEWNEWMRSPASTDGRNTDEHPRRGAARHRRALRTGPGRRRPDPGRAGRSVLRRPRLPVRRPRGSSLDVRHARARRHPRRGRGRDRHPDPRHRTGSERAQPRHAVRARVDLTLAALADPVRRRSIELLAERPHRAGELAGALGVSPPVMSRHLRVLRDRASWSTRSIRRSTPRVRIYSLRTAADGRAEGVARRRRSRMGPAARRVQGPRGARVSRSRVLVALRSRRRRTRTFAAFTGEIGEWWRPNGLFRFTDRDGGRLAFEPEPPERLVEIGADGERFEIGRGARVGPTAPPRVRMAPGRLPRRPVDRGRGALRRGRHRHPRDRRALRLGRHPPGARGTPRLPARRVPATGRRMVAGPAPVAARPRHAERRAAA